MVAGPAGEDLGVAIEAGIWKGGSRCRRGELIGGCCRLKGGGRIVMRKEELSA